MNVKYFYEFEGLDRVLNRVEILCEGQGTAVEIQGTGSPFVLEYPEVKKLEAIQASGAKVRLISERIFQFVDLHTDDMQRYVIKFYRDGVLYWMGYLDSELYSEDLSAYPPYPVEFSAADFNIFERLMYRDEADRRFTGIDTLIGHLKRCFDKLGLPFQRLYIGCSTTAEGIALGASETLLHRLYVQSSNFYDEDGEAMSCREVVESILEPFGLMMVQREASVYIYDYNTVKAGDAMRCYNFADFSYEGDVVVNFSLGDFSEIGFASTDATFGFEEMINNVKISCSPYMDTVVLRGDVTKENLKTHFYSKESDKYKKETYEYCPGWEALGERYFNVYINKDDNKTIVGASIQKVADGIWGSSLFRLKTSESLITTPNNYYLSLSMECYVSVRDNPFDTEDVAGNKAVIIELPVNLYTTDDEGNILYYFNNVQTGPKNPKGKWVKSENGAISPEACRLMFSQSDLRNADVLNGWITNCDYGKFDLNESASVPEKMPQKVVGTGLFIQINSEVYGNINLEFVDRCFPEKIMGGGGKDYWLYPINMGENPTEIKDVLVNNVQLSICDGNQKEIKSLDFEFKSYVNKKVATDFEEKDLKVVSCNEEMIPVGKGNLLALRNNRYELQLRFTRAGQTDILERLLMCTIHSNYTTKNRVVSVDVRMTDNPVMRYVRYDGVIGSDGMLVKGCSLDFDRAVTRVTAADFSGDVMVLSSIPYDE